MKEYTENDMIQFGIHINKKKDQINLDIEWELTEYLGGKSIENLNILVVPQRSELLCFNCGQEPISNKHTGLCNQCYIYWNKGNPIKTNCG